MLLPRATMLALTADRPSPAQPVTASGECGEYWLGHCKGFRVGSPEGEVGVVEFVVYAAGAGRPAFLAVTGGRLLLHTRLCRAARWCRSMSAKRVSRCGPGRRESRFDPCRQTARREPDRPGAGRQVGYGALGATRDLR
jgi:hypothetical protein